MFINAIGTINIYYLKSLKKFTHRHKLVDKISSYKNGINSDTKFLLFLSLLLSWLQDITNNLEYIFILNKIDKKRKTSSDVKYTLDVTIFLINVYQDLFLELIKQRITHYSNRYWIDQTRDCQREYKIFV